MFTHNIGTTAKKAVAIATAFAFGTGLSLMGAGAAHGDEVPTSYAEGQFLSGSLLGTDLADIVALEGAEAYNDGTEDKVTSKDPLHATALQAVDIEVPGGVQVEALTDYLDVGVVNQYAEASKNGQSMASSGAIGDDGAIGVGNVGSGSAGDLDVNLNGLLGTSYASLVSDLRLSLEAVAAQAVGNLDTAYGDYTLADATLNFTSPAIANLSEKVLAALGVVDAELLGLNGSNSLLAVDISALLKALGLVASPTVMVSITADVEAAVRPLLIGTYGNGAVSFNLETGTVQIDLETLLGGDLNDLPPNTELLTDAVINPVLKGITGTIDSLIDSIIVRVDQTLRQAVLNVDVDLDITTPVTGKVQECTEILVDVVGPVGSTVQQVLDGVVGGTIGGVSNNVPLGQVLPGVGGVLGGLFGNGSTAPQILPTHVVGQTVKTVCSLVDKVLNNLATSVHVDIHGTVQQILNGKAPASAKATVLGVVVPVDLQGILATTIGHLGLALFDTNDGAVQKVLDALNINLLDPATDGLLGIKGLHFALTDILSIKVNVQETYLASARGMAPAQAGMMFTETAVRVSALGATAVVNVAAATVGPNVNRVIDPDDPDCTVNCGPGGPGGPGDPGDPNNPSSSGDGGRLAMTGVGIATLVAVILALLAAGAYLAREGYRKSHQQA